ncbi:MULTISPECIES: glycosyltransferase [Proteiniphilum]|uniref:glycosyltransferase n=1 Tax=Proteiniphilum TaxID=294702 RepID=UPI0028A71164|nr:MULTISPECIES: glycosyltransferase [Proteiniphilum]MDY9918308.1 glycosyltransferase [Proteiniphilum sp.]
MTQTDNPLVSVILVTYNSAPYVVETLESVKKQTWKNIEIIISDDGSTDNTILLCSGWIERNEDRFVSIKLITVEKNTGIPSNCNRGLRAANGEWIKMIGGDDKLLRNAVTDNLTYARCFPDASFIISDVQEIDENGMLIRDSVINKGLIFFSSLPTAKKQLKNYSRWPFFLNSPTFFFKRELIDKIDYIDEEFRIFEDMTTLVRVMENGIKLYYMRKPTVAYRVHRSSISRSLQMDEFRKKETFRFFRKYRKPHLNPFNPIDLSVHYESWLIFKYKGFNGRKGFTILRKFSLFYWYLRVNGIKMH